VPDIIAIKGKILALFPRKLGNCGVDWRISARLPEKSILFQFVVRDMLWLIRFWLWYGEKFRRWP